jgi:DNA topoisomerase-1
VNDYLREVTGGDFTAKDFRTWAGTVLAATTLAVAEPPRSQRQAKRTVNRAMERVGKSLGNTAAIARKSYVHPDVIELYLEGSLSSAWRRPLPQRAPRSTAALRADEHRALRLLRSQANGKRKAA